MVKGAILLCDQLANGLAVLDSGAIGSIMQGESYRDVAFLFPLPASYLNTSEGSEVGSYINSTRYIYIYIRLKPIRPN